MFLIIILLIIFLIYKIKSAKRSSPKPQNYFSEAQHLLSSNVSPDNPAYSFEEQKGRFGENAVSNELRSLPNDKYNVLNDILLNTARGTVQIDHIIVSIYGIFVMETKNFFGQIYGKDTDDFWTQNIYGKKYYFKNPIHQNYGHIMALKECLQEFKDIPFKSIVAFTDRSDLKVYSNKSSIIYTSSALKHIEALSKTVVLSQYDVIKISQKINENNIKDPEIRNRHARNIQQTLETAERNIENGLCPKCGHKPMKYSSQYGSFTACSNFPNCNFKLR